VHLQPSLRLLTTLKVLCLPFPSTHSAAFCITTLTLHSHVKITMQYASMCTISLTEQSTFVIFNNNHRRHIGLESSIAAVKF